jgi:(1->4)-alpha-D-glucan 1-alpha-D-glucosylmutase
VRTPTTTYRLQLRAEFGFRDAAAVVPYLSDLGVSHVYCSPVLQAAPGSAHGYDVVDHSRLSDDLGGEAGWAELVAACESHGLGLVVDVVPNHMAWPTPERLNPVLWDVLRHGRASEYADWLDVDWDAQDGKILLPVLGKPLRDAVADGDVVVDRDAELVRYYNHEFPMAQGTLTLDEQHYRLAHWRTGNDELNYRRFFDIATLMGVRVELPEVFEATHRTLLSLPGPVDGWRIDHPDGLANPGGYLDDLAAVSPNAWVVVEKILGGEETLPRSWKCAGTTGYDALNMITGVLVDDPSSPRSGMWSAPHSEPKSTGSYGNCSPIPTRRVPTSRCGEFARRSRTSSSTWTSTAPIPRSLRRLRPSSKRRGSRPRERHVPARPAAAGTARSTGSPTTRCRRSG